MNNLRRCDWVPLNDPLYIRYHDEEWGVPLHDDRRLFELLILEGAQAGLSWRTILKRRENYARAFDNFDPEKVALYDESKIRGLLLDAGIIRNERKIRSTVQNAKSFLKVQEEFGSFDSYVWRFVGGVPKVNHWKNLKEIPSKTSESEKLSKDLLNREFKFVGSTICYAFMQSIGMVNDHLIQCFRYDELRGRK